MNELRELQQRAYRAIVLGESVRLPVSTGSSRRLAARLGVYRNNARETFRRTLAATYGVVERLVGDECFRSLASDFMRGFPSRSGDLGRFGGEFPLLLDILYRDTAFAYLADVARLEWAYAEAETAAGSPRLDLRALADAATRDDDALRVALHPACRLVGSPYPVMSIWQANQAEEVARVGLGTGAEFVLVCRRSGAVRLHRCDEATYAFAFSLAAGESLLEAQDVGLAVTADFDAGRALALLVSLGALTAYRC